MPCRSRSNISHKPLVSIQLCLVLPPPSSPSCTCILLSTFLSPDLFSKYSLVGLFHCGLVVSSALLACCLHVSVFRVHRPGSLSGGNWLYRVQQGWSSHHDRYCCGSVWSLNGWMGRQSSRPGPALRRYIIRCFFAQKIQIYSGT